MVDLQRDGDFRALYLNGDKADHESVKASCFRTPLDRRNILWMIVFDQESWSRYYEATFFLFHTSSGELRVWMLSDDDEIDEWHKFFISGDGVA